MKKLTPFLLLILISANVFAKDKKLPIIEVNTKFTLELEKIDDTHYSYKVLRLEPFDEQIPKYSEMEYIDDNLGPNIVQGIFTRGPEGMSKSVLMLKIGVSARLDYTLKIKIHKRREMIETSTNTLFKGARSSELWRDEIDEIQFSDFRISEMFKGLKNNTWVDSTCIKNPMADLNKRSEEFAEDFKELYALFKDNKSLQLDNLVKAEDSIDTDVSYQTGLPYWATYLYPNNSNVVLDSSIRLAKTECPYFNSYTQYFYTADSSVKFVCFGWKEFKHGEFKMKDEGEEKSIEKALAERYNLIQTKVTSILGEPKKQDSKSMVWTTKWPPKDGVTVMLYRASYSNSFNLILYKD